MRQAVVEGPGEIVIREVGIPPLAPNELLMRTERIGICGSDVHVFDGKHPYTIYPVVQGHEVSGTVAEVGTEVEGFTIGDRITFAPQVTCGTCHACQNGMYHICETLKVMGFQTDGAAQDFFAVPAANALKLGRDMSLDQGALVEPIAVALHALGRAGRVEGNVLVLGAGPIGNLVAQIAHAKGAESTMVTDISGFRLAKAQECGVTHAVNTQTADLKEAILEHFGPNGPDLIVECVGSQATIDEAIDSARKGTTVVVVGVFGMKPAVDVGLIQDRELTLRGSLMYQKSDFVEAVRIIESEGLVLDPLITHRYPLEGYLEAYRQIKSGNEHLKVLIELT
jgi:L-iditol 2-dehydrogenase